jgi:hypothetical protein
MATIKSRGETIDVSEMVSLTVQFKDNTGSPVDTDITPQISIVQPSGNILLAATSTGVNRIDVGKYSYTFTVPLLGPYGVYNDIWSGYISGNYVEATLSFAVVGSNIPSINSDGYHKLGDDPGFNYSQTAIQNINKLIKMLKARLNSAGKIPGKDEFGNTVYQDCDIFSVEQYVNFLSMALSYFNSVPYFTYFTFDDSTFIAQFGEILVQGAALYALASQALIEKGKDFNINDNGISYTPATMADLLQSQYSGELNVYWDQLKYIKNSMRPAALGMGTFSMNNGSVAFRRLRHLRQRKFY